MGKHRKLSGRRPIETLESRQLMAATLPAGFQETTFATGLDTPTAQAFAPDGRLFVLEKWGNVRVITRQGQLLPTPFLTVAPDTQQDRGLVGLAFDPNFNLNHYIYVYYTKTDTAGTRNRLSRFTASTSSPDLVQPNTETPIIEIPHTTNIHTGGAMGFGKDGMLYLGVGDGGVSTTAQDLSDLRGKVLRLNVSDLAHLVPSDNPFYNQAGARGEIYAYGLRNPFSGAMQPGGNTFWISDVGQDQWEEVNVIQRAGNYGWPLVEGASSNPSYVNPIYTYSHAGYANAAVTGGTFYTGNQFPTEYANSYFFSDYLNGFMRRVDSTGQEVDFGTNLAGALDVDMGPDGSLYYISASGNGFYGDNRPVYKISYVGSANRAPAAVATADVYNGYGPLAVNFSGAGSTDPDNDNLIYTWNFGDNTPNASGRDVAHTYATNGTYQAVLTVNDGRGGVVSATPISITVGNRPPTGVIQAPSTTLLYSAGDTISFSGSASDAEDGVLSASNLSWMVLLVHNTHTHNFAGPFNGVSSGSFAVPLTGHTESDHYYRIVLTATDSGGLTSQTVQDVHQRSANLTLQTSPAGLSVQLDGQPKATPLVSGSLVGATRTLIAPATQVFNGATYEFVSWSDGGAANHDIAVPAADTTYTANYRLATQPTTQTLGASADAYVRDGSTAAANYGSALELYVKRSASAGYTRQSLLRFDTSAIAGDVSNVKLRLFGRLQDNSATNVLTEVFGTTASWQEGTVNWNNRPAAGTKAGSLTVADGVGRWYDVDITAYVQAERAAGRAVINLLLTNPKEASPYTVFSSREAAANQPQLLVTASAAPTRSAFQGTPAAVPGLIELENFDEGGEGVAFHDLTTSNDGGAYRQTAVDIEATGDSLGGYNLAYLKAGEWTEYTINVASSGAYTLESRVASLGAGGSFHVEIDGVNVTGTITIADTGGWQIFQTLTKAGVQLAAGKHVLRFAADSNGAAGFVGNVNWLRLTAQAPVITAPAAPTNLSAVAQSWAKVQLTWTDNANNETGVKVERRASTAATWDLVATLSADAASYLDASVVAGTAYSYRVRAVNAGGESANSNEAAVTTPAANAPITLTSSGDAYVRDGSYASSNFGGATEIVIKKSTASYNREGFISFDLSSLSGTLSSALLRLYGKLQDNSGANVVTDVYGVNGVWQESTLTWNNRPTATGTKLGSITVKDGTARWYELDIASYLNAERAAGRTTATLVLRNPATASPYTTFGSREVSGAQPQLVVGGAASTPPPPATRAPFSGTPIAVPGLIEAENFDAGGEGISWHDSDSTNQGSVFRQGGVDIEATQDTGGGFNVGWIRAGEWMEYTINVPTAGPYTLEARLAAGSGYGGTFHVEFNGVNKTGALTFPSTGDWQNWQTISLGTVNLAAGTQVMRVQFDSATGTGGDIGNLNWLRLAPAQSQPLAWPTSWQSGASAPIARFEATAHTFNGKIYAFGGFINSSFNVTQRVDVYDAASNTWSRLRDLPADMAQTHIAIADDGQYMYLAGGFAGNLQSSQTPSQVATSKVYRYDPQTDTWTAMLSLPSARGAGGMAIVGRTLHYIGGNPPDRVTNLPDHLVLNLDNPTTWTTAAAHPNPKDHFSIVVLNGKIYTVGGEHGHDQLHEQQSDLHVYDPATDRWTQLASMPVAKSHMEAGTFVYNGRIVFAGGQIDNFGSTSGVVAYDPLSDTWSTLAPLPAQRQGAVVTVIGNKVIVTLGAVTTNSPQSTTWIGTV